MGNKKTHAKKAAETRERLVDQLVTSIFELSKDVRYVAVYDGTDLTSRSRPGQTPSSDGESDTYEELLVNPTLLLLTKQRGNIDCGGLRHVLVAYGHFDQLVVPQDKGHISICLELGSDHEQLLRDLKPLLEDSQTGAHGTRCC